MDTRARFNIHDLLNLLSHREAVQRAESELAGSNCSVEDWKNTLQETEREVLKVYEHSVQRAFDDIVFKTTGGIN
ncbi:hypothetical protein FHP88_15545 [Sedimenticola selenatireducens]|uniref:Uncharacterized protein n=1 Tax=Sedimenticola selenatireducens TaxID=191960 RepID=A0A557S0I7_9GAMM|nr:hypothetical protein [Sedimenticola selenatireducens]TVO70867.1 hypothetical protein FHP88_15545 [Sedimenticola selenatireducens]